MENLMIYMYIYKYLCSLQVLSQDVIASTMDDSPMQTVTCSQASYLFTVGSRQHGTDRWC